MWIVWLIVLALAAAIALWAWTWTPPKKLMEDESGELRHDYCGWRIRYLRPGFAALKGDIALNGPTLGSVFRQVDKIEQELRERERQV